jgi:DNA-binding transcriptional regulator YiaG
MPEDQLIAELIAKAVQPLKDEITQLREERDLDRAEFERFKATHRAFAVQTGKDIDALFEANLAATAKPQPTQRDRAEILRALLVANGGKMLAKDARQKMHLSKSRFSELLSVCDFLETKPLHTDRRKMIIILKSELVPRN